MNDIEKKREIAKRVADEIDRTLKHGWGDMVYDAVDAVIPDASDEEKDEIFTSIAFTIIDSGTGKDLLEAGE